MSTLVYRMGQGTVLDLLDTLRTLGEIRTTPLDYTERVLLAEVDMLAASGKVDPAGAP